MLISFKPDLADHKLRLRGKIGVHRVAAVVELPVFLQSHKKMIQRLLLLSCVEGHFAAFASEFDNVVIFLREQFCISQKCVFGGDPGFGVDIALRRVF